MASRTTKIKIDTEANTAAIKKAASEVNKLQQAGDEVVKSQSRLGSASAKASRRVSHSAGMAAMQLQDVAVQAQMGTDSLRILGQQGPQLLSAFGPGGMLAGLGVAVGAGIVSALKEPEQKLSEVLDQMEQLESAGHSISEITFKAMENSLKATAERARETADAFSTMMQMQEDSEARSLSAADALIEAEMTLKKLRGEDTTMQSLQLKQEQEQRKIEQERVAQKNALAKARTEAVEKEARLTAELEKQNLLISQQRAKVAGAEGRRETAFEAVRRAEDKMGRNVLTLGLSKAHTPSQKQTDRFNEAHDAVQAINIELDEQRAELENLLLGQQNLTAAIRNAKEQAQNIDTEIGSELAKIDMAAKAQSIVSAGNSMGQQLDILEEALKEGLAAVGPGAAPSVLARLSEILKDGIQSDELDELVQVTSQLGIKLNQGFGKQNQTMKQALDALIMQQDQLNILDKQFQMLEARQRSKRK